MNALEIPRVAIRDEWTIYKPLQDELFDKCREKLGYDANDSTASEHNSATLNSILKKSGVEPLSLEAVHRYQAAMLRKVRRFYLRLVLHIGGALGLNALAGYVSGWTFNPFTPTRDTAEMVVGYFLLLLAEAAVVGFALGLAIWEPSKDWEWRSTNLRGYDKPIPQFALSQALTIQKINPEVAFHVEELRANDRIADPFLRVSFGDRTSYIAVWEEPKFEGRSTK